MVRERIYGGMGLIISDEIVLETYASGTDYEKRIEDDEVNILTREQWQLDRLSGS